jgi:hypothetical protein
MPTRAELRTALRRRLEDAGASPLWDDATLNDAVEGAIRRYGARFPRETVATIDVTAGATSVPVTTAGIEGERIARVLDEAGAIVPRLGEAPGPESAAGGGNAAGAAGLGQAWRWWSGELRLQRPAAVSGIWRIEYRGPRTIPADDVSAVDVATGDEEIVLVLAAAIALRRRAVEDGKRGTYGRGPSPALALAERAEIEAERLMARRKRRATGGWLAE